MRKTRILAMVLCIAMVLSTMSFTVFADENAYAAKIGNVECADATAIISALKSASGDVTVEIYGKVKTEGFSLNNSNITKLSFVAKNDDAEICVDGVSYIDIRNTSYPIEYNGLTLSHINAGQNIDGYLPQYFSTYNGGNVTYKNCTFPNGVTACGSKAGTTYKFIDCIFNNTTSGLYSLWIYGNSTNVVVEGGTFSGVRGIKLYSEGSNDFSSLSVSGATFSNTITEKHAIVLTKGERVTLTNNTFNNTKGMIQIDDDYASSIEGKAVVIDGTEYVVDSKNFVLEEVKPEGPTPSGSINGGLVNIQNSNRTFLTIESYITYANVSIVVKVYDANDVLLATSSLIDTDRVILGKENWGGLSTMVGINCTDDWWNTVWEDGKLSADYVPAKATLFVDGIEMNTGVVQMRAAGTELPVVWAEVPGVPAAGPVEVTTYEELVAALNKDNANVIMMNDITASAKLQNGYKDGATGIILESGDVLDGNGKTLTINDANGTYGAVIAMKGGEVKNLTIAGAFRGVFMPGANGDVVVDNCVFKDVVYTFNSDAGSKDYTVTIKNSTINGWTSFSNVHKSVTFENCTFGEGSGYAYCRPYQPTEFNGCDFGEDYKFDASQTAANSLVFNNCTYDGTPISASNGWQMFSAGSDVIIDGEKVHFIASDKAVASVGNTAYDNLKDAFAAADGKTVTLLADIALTETITVAAGKTVTLDLNGKKITGTDKAASGNFALITNKGTLTVDDSVGTGAITLTAENDRSWNALSAVISNEGGTLIVKNGKIEHLGGSAMAYGIDNNSTLGETKVVVKGGTIASPYRGIRAFQNSKAKMNSVVMEGGKIVAKAGIWMHQSGADSLGEVTVTGGKIEAVSNAIVTDIHSGAKTTITIKGGEFSNTNEAANLLLVWPFSNMSTVTEANETVMNIEGGSFDCAGEGNLIGVLNGADTNTDVAVSGGTFSEKIAEEYIAEGFKLVSNSDGTYGVKEDTPWTTATDAGFYKENGVVKGLMRYLFHFGGVGTITDAGVKFIKGSDLAAKVQAGEIAKGEASNTFFADINEIPENTTGRYYAMGFVTIGEKTYWSNPIFCEPDFTRYFKALDIQDNGGKK